MSIEPVRVVIDMVPRGAFVVVRWAAWTRDSQRSIGGRFSASCPAAAAAYAARKVAQLGAS